jgi:hypothetical protein
MKVSEMVEGEIYNWGGRRARLDSISANADGTFTLALSHGRSFQHSADVITQTWRPDSYGYIKETWQGGKDRKAQGKADSARAMLLNVRLQELSNQLNLQHMWVDSDGKLYAFGDLDKIALVIDQLEEVANNSQPSSGSLGQLLS